MLLSVDVKEIFNQKIKLDNTSNYDSIQDKNKQVCNNLIKNANSIYENIINNIIDEQIDKQIPYINSIESNEYNENEAVLCRILLRRKTIDDFNRYIISEFGENRFAYKGLMDVINKFTENYFQKQQQATTINIIFKGRKPKLFVLKRLTKIAEELDIETSVMFTQRRLKEIINIILEDPDPRTAKDYLRCLTDFSKYNAGTSIVYEAIHNMRGFSIAVSKLLEEKRDEND